MWVVCERVRFRDQIMGQEAVQTTAVEWNVQTGEKIALVADASYDVLGRVVSRRESFDRREQDRMTHAALGFFGECRANWQPAEHDFAAMAAPAVKNHSAVHLLPGAGDTTLVSEVAVFTKARLRCAPYHRLLTIERRRKNASAVAEWSVDVRLNPENCPQCGVSWINEEVEMGPRGPDESPCTRRSEIPSMRGLR